MWVIFPTVRGLKIQILFIQRFNQLYTQIIQNGPKGEAVFESFKMVLTISTGDVLR